MNILKTFLLLSSIAVLDGCGGSNSQSIGENLSSNSTNNNAARKRDVVSIRNKLSFGFCKIDCNREIKIENIKINFIVTGNYEFQDSVKKFEGEITLQEWRNILQSIDKESFWELPDVIGNPDGGDGGAEMVEIILADGTNKRIIFDYTDGTPPEMKEFTKKMAMLRARFSKQIKDKTKIKKEDLTNTLNKTNH